jgi:hypothetical protein
MQELIFERLFCLSDRISLTGLRPFVYSMNSGGYQCRYPEIEDAEENNVIRNVYP